MRPSEELAKIDVDVWVKWWAAPTRTRRDHEKDGDRCVENLPNSVECGKLDKRTIDVWRICPKK